MKGIKKCVGIVVCIVVSVSVIISVGVVSGSALTPGYINNLNYNSTVARDGIIGYSSNSSYIYCFSTYSNNVFTCYGVSASGSLTNLCHITVSGAALIGSCIDGSGCWAVFTTYYQTSYRVVFYRIKFTDNAFGSVAVSGMEYPLQSFNYQLVCGNGNGSGYSLCGMVASERNGDHWGSAYVYSDASNSTSCHVISGGFGNSGGDVIPVGCLLNTGGNIINTYSSVVYGLVDGMSMGSIQAGYSGSMIYGATYQTVQGFNYIYGVDPYNLSFCQYELTSLNGVIGVNVNTSVPAFFAGSPSLEEGASYFPIQFGLSVNRVAFWFCGSKISYLYTIELLPSDQPGSFWKQGVNDVSITVSGIEVSVGEQFENALENYYARLEQEMLSKMAAESLDLEDYELSEYLVVPDYSETDDINVGEFITGLVSIDGDNGQKLFLVTGLTMVSAFIMMLI